MKGKWLSEVPSLIIEDDFLRSQESETPKITPEESNSTFHSSSVLGCKHYQRQCKMYAACCNAWYTCRFCHDEVRDHQLNRHIIPLLVTFLFRHATEWMLCMKCTKVQKVAKYCSNCSAPMALYYCQICKFWDNSESKKIVHCEKCKICRIGTKDTICHCDKCGTCLEQSSYLRHKCRENLLDCVCPLCREYLFTSIIPVASLNCSHPIHSTCRDVLVNRNYRQCLVCKQ